MKNLSHLILFLLFSVVCVAQNPCPSPSISGKLTYDNLQNSPLNASMVYLRTLSGIITDSCTSDQYGNYRFCAILNGNYKLTAKTNYPWGGVNSSDALIALHHYVEIITLVGLNFKAGDVNANLYINGTDALMITKRFVQMSSSYPIGDWVFEEPQIIICDTTSQIINIKALCAGDLDGSHVPFTQSFVTCGDTITDQRDNQKYPTVQIGTQCWMKKNLNVGTMVTSTKTTTPHSDCNNNNIIEKYCINNDSAICAIYGGLYDWNEMMKYDSTPGIQGICPTGWHIPTDNEWCTLTTYLDPNSNCSVTSLSNYASTNAGGKLKESGTIHWSSPNSGATNQTGFTAIGSGDRDQIGNTPGLKYTSPFCCSTKFSTNNVIYWGVNYYNSGVFRVINLMNYGDPIRCIKD